MGLLTGKTALVTGAARGIGKAIALKFAAEGANVAFTDLVIDENGQATEAEIAAFGVKAKGYASNAADFAQTEEVVKQVKEDFGSIDILVNNAGITKDGLMLRMTEAQWDAVIAVNLKSAFNFIHACTPIMMRQKGGSIINMASVVGVQCRAVQLFGFQGRYDSFGQVHSSGDGSQRYPCQCHSTGLYRDGHDGSIVGRRACGMVQEDTFASWRHAGRRGQRGTFLGFRPVFLRVGTGYPD